MIRQSGNPAMKLDPKSLRLFNLNPTIAMDIRQSGNCRII
jgi:hypothetical protein